MQKTNKNILIVTHYYPPHIGGIEIVAFNQARQLALVGHTVTVITSRIGSEPQDEVVQGVRVLRIPVWNYFEKWGVPFPVFSPRIWSALSRVVKTVDVVHVHDIFYISSFLAVIAARLYKRPIVLTQHVARVMHSSRLVMIVQRIAYATWGAFVLHSSAIVIVYNDIVKQFLTNECGVPTRRVIELRNGIDLKLFHPATDGEKLELRRRFGLPLEKPLVLFVGRLVPKKGAMKLFEASDKEYDIAFVGSGDALDGRTGTSGVHIMGSMGQAELAKLYRTADLFVFPSEGEMFTLAMQEAMASGLPVVTTNEQGYAKYDIDRDLIALVQSTSDELKTTIKRLINDKSRLDSMSAYSLRLARERFDCEANTKHMLKVYSDACVRKQRIAFISDTVLPWFKGGKETRLYEISKRLVAEDREIHIYTMKWWDGPIMIERDGVYYHAICRKYPIYTAEGRRSIYEAIMFSLAVFKLLFERFDVLDVDHMPFFPLFSARIVTWLRGKNLYATWHEVWGQSYWMQYMGGLSGLFGHFIERTSFLLPDVIISNSVHTTERLRASGFNRAIKTVSLGVDLEGVYSADTSSETSDVIFVGRLLSHKNADMLVRAIAIVKKVKPMIKALIVGDGPERSSVQALVNQLGLHDNVRMLSRVADHADVYSLMKASQMLVLPSVREGFGIVVVEAHAAGIPVITTSHEDNAAKDLIREGVNGILAEADPESIAEKILEVLKTRETMKPREGIERYNWNYVAKKIENVFA